MSIEPLCVNNIQLGYGDKVVLSDVSFTLPTKAITVVMGGSGGGKSTLLKGMIGLLPPMSGDVMYGDASFYTLDEPQQKKLLMQIGVLYQGGALWSDRTVIENVAFPLEEYCPHLGPDMIYDIARYKLSLVGLDCADDLMPDELSGGMRKRAALARAMALDPKVLFLDEPSAGLDPLNARRLDQLILQLHEGLDTSFVVITHDIDSIMSIAQNAIFLENGKLAAQGSLKEVVKLSEGARSFLSQHKDAHAIL